MKRLSFRLSSLILLCLIPCLIYARGGGKRLAIVSDVHYLSRTLVNTPEALMKHERATGRSAEDLHQVLEKVVADILHEEIGILLIPGDLTNHGERQSHLDFQKILHAIQEKGVDVFVVPGNHDVNIPANEGISKEEFAEMYAPFGYANALASDRHSLSYLYALDDSTWLLALDTNRYDEHERSSITAGRIRPGTMEWAIQHLEQAKRKGITVLGMMHHGLVEHMPFQSDLFAAYLVENWEREADRLADAGLRIVFTGHFHSNDVSKRTSPNGHVIYDVETASLAQYPFAYRIMELEGGRLDIDTRFITSIPANPRLEEDYRERMMATARRVAAGRLKSIGLPMPKELEETLVDLVARLSVIHAKGDEELDDELKKAIQTFANLLGGEADMESFSFDFPPQDNQLVIELY